MKKSKTTLRTIVAACAALAAAAAMAGPAQAAFGLNSFKVAFEEADGSAATQAGGHPHAMTTSFGVNHRTGEGDAPFTEGRVRDVFLAQVAGLAGDTTAYPRCSTLDFVTVKFGSGTNQCPDETAVGVVGNSVVKTISWFQSPVFNLVPPPGTVLRLGFRVVNQNIVVDVGVNPEPPYNPVARVRNISEQELVYGNKTQLWGNPSDPLHNDFRGNCYNRSVELEPGEEFEFLPQSACAGAPSVTPRGAFLTLPTRCAGPNTTSFAADAWENPARFLANGEPDLADPAWATGGFATPPFTGCGKLGFAPALHAKPTSRAAQSGSGLDLSFDVDDLGLPSTNPGATAQSQIRKVVVTLPRGMTANPSLAEGLEACSEAELARETLGSAPGAGCPEGSKIGTIEAVSPIVDQPVGGQIYVATPYDNLAEDSLIAFYMVLKNPQLGVIVKQVAKVTPDPTTGQLVAVTDDIPQFPLAQVRVRLREGGRSPLITPPDCGSFDVEAQFTPWSGGSAVTSSSPFQIVAGPGEGPCPSGAAPFEPGFEAGTINNAAGAFSPFSMRLTRSDGEQDMVRFSAELPPGVVAKLAGTTQCSDAVIAAARGKTGLQERAEPSCPESSAIGKVSGGAGVGSQLTYVPGKIYMAGPTNGAPLSVVAIVPAVAGPFDVGNVVVREALRIDPRTAEVTVDGGASDPLPHILAGIPLNVRDIRVEVDKPDFTLNPTSCDPSAAIGLLSGGGTALAPTGETQVSLESRFQAAGCASLGFKPRLALRLKGGTARGAHPKLRGVFRPRPGDANLKRLVVRFPRSAFLDQAHIRTICTRVQFAANGGHGGGCPKGAIYGRVRAWTPLLDEPLRGPVYLRSSNNNLPDFVAALHGIVDVETVARIDSKKGGIRATFTNLPDAPLSRVIVDMQGGKKGLIVNSTNICRGKRRANTPMLGHNGKRQQIKPVVRPLSCAQKKRKRARHRRR
ncbi:MAG TPA: hypothetical protein VFT19_03100 [Solirubrobacterales bacterium]|nr:hypothetical protein [Solirubrobacterales bacterium]